MGTLCEFVSVLNIYIDTKWHCGGAHALKAERQRTYVAMATCCCSDVVKMRQPHTAPNVPVLRLAGSSHVGAEQPIGREEHFVWIESLSALWTKEKSRSDGDELIEDFSSRFLLSSVSTNTLKLKTPKSFPHYKKSLFHSVQNDPSHSPHGHSTAVVSARHFNSPLNHSGQHKTSHL